MTEIKALKSFTALPILPEGYLYKTSTGKPGEAIEKYVEQYGEVPEACYTYENSHGTTYSCIPVYIPVYDCS